VREILLDTETTGLEPDRGDRIVEIALIETIDRRATGKVFHALLNPEREIDHEAVKIHGHTRDSLAGEKLFADVVSEFIEFIGDAPLVAHNAPFDVAFINAELALLWLDPIEPGRVVDTLALARAKFQNKANSLDALCDRFHISRARRVKHGAMLDAELLVEVYAELQGERQKEMNFDVEAVVVIAAPDYSGRPARKPLITEAEYEAHKAFVATLKGSTWAVRSLPHLSDERDEREAA
jgi:DNA polymerase-3 subunit epsilon